MTLRPGRGRLHVDVEPMGDARWERVERRVLADVDAGRDAAGRVARGGGADGPVNANRAAGWRLREHKVAFAFGGVGLLAAAIALFVVLRAPSVGVGGPEAVKIVAGNPPTRVVTPPGGTTRVEVGAATVTMSSDTVIEARIADDGAVTIDLVRGKVACDVTPRPGRPPFAVLADDVTVTVVGTAFTVDRTSAAVLVEVQRGKVSVNRGELTEFLLPSDRWSSDTGRLASLDPTKPNTPAHASANGSGRENGNAHANENEVDVEIEVENDVGNEPGNAPPTNASPKKRGKPFIPATPDDLARAKALEKKDPVAALRAYKIMSHDAPDAIASEALVGYARLSLRGKPSDPRTAIAAAKSYERRFPRGADLITMLQIQIEAYLQLGESHNAHAAARRFAERYPNQLENLKTLNISP